MAENRREFIHLTSAALAASLLGSCRLVRPPVPRCPFDAALSDPDSLLAIDVHAHIFNATDLQIGDFINRVAVRQSGGLGALARILGKLLQGFAWATAPDVDKELEALGRIRPAILACDADENRVNVASLRQEQFSEGRRELQEAAQRQMVEVALQPNDLSDPTESLSESNRGLKQILELPETYDEFFAPQSGEISLERKTPASVLKFVIEMFQYRYVSVYNYLEAYNENNEVKIDLMTPAPVDFDWWLSQGKPTKSRLPDQMRLMKEISILTGGRVHTLVPFDPFRQVVFNLGNESGFSPIDLVRTSISEYGAIGVKLYPPMGFAPYGNEKIGSATPDMWSRRSWLTDIVERDDFPRRLDESLAELYEFCADQEVPVMGHSNESNGPAEDFEELTAPMHWDSAISNFGDVSFSFGHFGGVGQEESSGQSNVQGFLELMAEDQARGEQRITADASYFSNVLDRPSALQIAMETIYSFGGDEPGPAFDRIMYGADWKMLVSEVDSQNYLRDLNRAMTRLEETFGADTRARAKFFGENASVFLGLQRGKRNRARMEEFYDINDMDAVPTWMSKVDDQLITA